ncbi:MAG: histidine kinase dimerization/phospho-acceptor domain-containing protein [Erythrobacter sp.]
MFFDDRLATVLRQRASSDVGLRTQYRQLLDILGAAQPGGGGADGAKGGSDRSLIASAWLRMDALAQEIPAADRAKMIRERGWRFQNPELAAHLADFEPDVASAALNRAQLTEQDWSALIPRLPIRARGFLRLRRDLPLDAETTLDRLGVSDRGLPSPEGIGREGTAPYSVGSPPPIEPTAGKTDPSEPVISLNDDTGSDEEYLVLPDQTVGIDDNAAPPHDIAAILDEESAGDAGADADAEEQVKPTPDDSPLPAAFDPAHEGRSEISALVERIAQFKRTRESGGELDGSEPRLPLGEDQPRGEKLVGAFGFAADAGGRIEWADGDVAAMVIGTRLVAPPRLGSADRETPVERAFARRQPISGGDITLYGAQAIAGEWSLDAQPRFTDDGNFSGYVGRFRRPMGEDPSLPSAVQREADRIRQLLHELRTPITAVQGYAEVIQQQLFGSAPHEYRALAAAIAADAARILSGFEELDRLARLETGSVDVETGSTDLGALIARTNRQLDQVLQPRMAGITLKTDDVPYIVALDTDEADSLIWRLMATIGGGCSAGEMLEATLYDEGGMAQLICDLPAQLLAEEDIFTAEVKPIGTAINAGLFGAGFALRLARAEARAAGGGLVRNGDTIALTLPYIDADDAASDCEASTDA